MIFFESFEKRIKHWLDFRVSLEDNENPIQSVIDFWNQAPICNLTCDPFDKSTWLDPWELLEENKFCDFTKILAIYYTLSLTDRFKNSYFEIQIINDKDAHEMRYILIVDDVIIGYFYNRAILQDDLPRQINIQMCYPMLEDYS